MATRRVAGIGVAAGGFVLACIGIGLAASAPGLVDGSATAGSLSDGQSQYDRGLAFNAAGWGLIGVGAAAVVAGVVLIALPSRGAKLRAMARQGELIVGGRW